MEQITIVQLLRPGDLIQTCISASLIQEQFKPLKLNLIMREEFYHFLTPGLISIFHSIITLDENHIKEIHQEHLPQVIRNKNLGPILNLSFCETSSGLLSLMLAPKKNGMLKRGKQVVVKGTWPEYIFSSVMSGPYNPYNLVDIYYEAMKELVPLDETMPKSQALQLVHQRFIPAALTNKTRTSIVIHPFASQERKHFSINKWAQILSQSFAESKELDLHFIASEGERVALTELITQMHQLIPLKQVNFHQHINVSTSALVELIQQSDLFIGNDSFCSQLTFFSQTPCLIFCVGNSRTHENTPYHDRSLILSQEKECAPCFPDQACPSYDCHQELENTTATKLIQKIIQQEFRPTFDPTLKLAKNTVMTYSYFDERSQLKFQQREQEKEIHSIFLVFYDILWSLYFFDQDVESKKQICNSETVMKLKGAEYALEKVYELYQFAIKFTTYSLQDLHKAGANHQAIANHIHEKISEIEKLISHLNKTHAYLAPLNQVFYLRRLRIGQENLAEFLENNLLVFHEAALYLKAMYELIHNTIVFNSDLATKESSENANN